MIVLRIFWGVFLAALVAFAFHRSWGLEHGKPSGYLSFQEDGKGKETAVWVTPLIFPVLLAVLCVCYLIWYGPEQGLRSVVQLAGDVLVTLSVYFLALLALLPLLRRLVSARACATLWLLPIFLFLYPQMTLVNRRAPLVVIPLPEGWLPRLLAVWLAGSVLLAALGIGRHLLVRRRLLSGAAPVTDPAVLAVWEEELSAAQYKKPVRLLASPNCPAPLSMGMSRRTRLTLLPPRPFPPEELRLIFRHEIRHLQRCDVDTKVFLAFCGWVCWFNPLVWVALRRAAADLERSCDEIVVDGCGTEERRRYAGLLLDTAGAGQGGFTSCLSAGAAALRYRLRHIVAPRSLRRGTVLLAAAMFCCTLCFGLTAFSPQTGTLAQLVLGEDGDRLGVESVSLWRDGSPTFLDSWEEEALLDTLSPLPLARLDGESRYYGGGGAELSVGLDDPSGGFTLLSLSDNLLEVWRAGESQSQTYAVTGPVPWEQLFSCLELDGPAG